MEKTTKKFLSILLCIAMLMSFPVVASANTAYDERFNGEYTAPSSTRNYLISGDDAKLTEWYGDRVTVGSKQYSVRQNQYGLNKDGNMIKAEANTKYTLWLSQYGVATLRFVVPEDGQYVISTLRNKQYSNDNEPAVYRNDVKVYEDAEGNKAAYYSIGTAEDEENNTLYTTVMTDEYQKGDILYIATSVAFGGYETQSLLENVSYYLNLRPNDTIYDIEIINKKDVDPSTCNHGISSYVKEEYLKDKSCELTETRECNICNNEFTRSYTRHDYRWTEIREPEDAKCDEKVTVTVKEICERCEDEILYHEYKDIGGHTLGEDKKIVRNLQSFENGSVGSGSWVLYEGTCTECNKYVTQQPGEAPCHNTGTWKYEHDFGVDVDSIDCAHPATCKTCGYVAAPHKYVDNEEAYKNTKCTHEYSKCSVCEEYSYNCINHEKTRYVQVTPQYGKVCGTYRIYCDECEEYITPVLTCHSYYTVKNEDGTTTTKCSRCGQVEGKDSGNNGGTSGGGSSSGSASTQDTSTNNGNTQSGSSSSAAVKAVKAKKVVVKKAKAAKKALVVTWKAVKNVTGYQIQISTNKKFKKNKKTITVAKKKATKKTVKKLKSKKKYYVRVRAYKVINGKKVYGKWSKVKTVTTK